ncbi:ABC transporter permease [Aporhodopirellula aestuarii]|uniref:Transport permease protein n=1 Tax=Aporhodopirellula aestuarii TaxID=2950107 RepID=A0ABT0U3Q7_9BACT|nr:ABC transporter permease [Aporhodopirellula aestuarii]MCM2371517.1 ABC transporter permease [Aporhodopirellula aestuarii]
MNSICAPSDTEEDEAWDLDIEPHASLLSLRLGEVWRYRDLLYLFVRRDIVSFYKQTILGPLWFFIQPLLTTSIYVLVFGQIAGLSTDGLPQVLFYLCGIAFWNYFSECFTKTATVFRDNASLFGKVYFPRIITPLSIVLSNLFRFAIQFVLFLLIAGYYYWRGEVHLQLTVLLFPLLVAIMAVLGLGLGMLFSAMTTKYRDMAFLLQFGVQLLMYASPVIYPFSQIPEKLQPLFAWNPLIPVFEAARHGFLGSGSVSPMGIAYSVLFSIGVFLISTLIFNRVERTFMDTV